MGGPDLYQEAWESYWRGISDIPGEAIWDTEPGLAAAGHLELLKPYADAGLPIVELGCGTGTQTRYLASRFPRAYGVDISKSAVEHARRADAGGLAEYRQLNLADPVAVRELHGRVGDANGYMRSVINQCDPPDRRPIAEAVATLVGRCGRAFVVELAEESRALLGEIARDPGGLPPKPRRVIALGIRPAVVPDAEIPELLRGAGLEVFSYGRTVLPQTEYRADGARIDLPAQWFVVGRP
jgi:SAM-dependent methyltransferase